MEVPTANVNWQDSGVKEPWVISTYVYFNTSGDKPEVYSFLWNNKGGKIKRTLLISNYDHGGLKMVDLSSFNKYLKTTWIRKYLDTSNQGKWKEFVELDLGKYGGNLIF